jgi:hypothetical protein
MLHHLKTIKALALAGGLVLGDSIALGTGGAMHAPTIARKSMGSCWIAAHTPRFRGAWAVISAGINDAPGACVEAIRSRVRARRVVWILPAPINSARAHVEAVAAANGDRTISYSCPGPCSTSNFHPESYAALAGAVEALLGIAAGRNVALKHHRRRRHVVGP